jgi:hypothetical protein
MMHERERKEFTGGGEGLVRSNAFMQEKIERVFMKDSTTHIY